MSSPEEVLFNLFNSAGMVVSLIISVWAIRASKNSTDEREFDALKTSVAVLTAHDTQRGIDIVALEKLAGENNTSLAVLEEREEEHHDQTVADHRVFRDFMQAVATGRVRGINIRQGPAE